MSGSSDIIELTLSCSDINYMFAMFIKQTGWRMGRYETPINLSQNLNSEALHLLDLPNFALNIHPKFQWSHIVPSLICPVGFRLYKIVICIKGK
uniref:Uncharacterized protein n=1 Tax=Pyxicephalus adspersus TaxID=30357 RepID=A0AAV3B172_PYXAD|nr:TPA: hypothetical protein GDO54_000342 [Pyxicephalus adspersus]